MWCMPHCDSLSAARERWHDLLRAEALAHETLAEHGVAVAKSFVVESENNRHALACDPGQSS